MQAQTIREENIIKIMQEKFLEIQSTVLNAFKSKGIVNPSEKSLLFLARGMLCNISLHRNFHN